MTPENPEPPHGRKPRRARSADEERALKLFVVLVRATMAVERHTTADIARHGLSPGEFAVLEALYQKGPLLLGEVQEKVLVSSGGITYLVDRLEARDLVERRPCETDRRARYAALTPAGEELMAGIFPDHARAIERALDGLSAEEQRAAIDLLKRLGKQAAARPLAGAEP